MTEQIHCEADGACCGCAHHHAHSEDHGMIKKQIAKLAAGMVLFLAPVLLAFDVRVEILLYFTAYLLVGAEVLLRAFQNILKGQVFDENFLMCIATIGAFAIGEFPEGVAVMLFYQLGELFQDIAVARSRRSITELMDIRPDFANLKQGDGTVKVAPEAVATGDLIVVRPGERVPLDGVVFEGVSSLDTSSLTGEPLPREAEKGTLIYSGSININGTLTVRVSKPYGESTVAKIMELVENASARKAPTEAFITKFARYYTPAVVGIAAALAVFPPLLIPAETFTTWIYRALIFLVASCPCALLISIPLGFFGGIGGAARNGILLKGGNYLEALNHIDTVVFDKTGTLTKGVFKVTRISPAHDALTKEALLEYAAYGECFSTHPIAVSLLKEWAGQIEENRIENYTELAGYGTKVLVNGKNILVGNEKLMRENRITGLPNDAGIETTVHVAVDGSYQGSIAVADEVKKDVPETMRRLRQLGIGKIIMLTGDKKEVAEEIGKTLGIDQVFSELLPGDKVRKLEGLAEAPGRKGSLAFVGDGINDAPALTRADVGVAMGGLGSDAAIEAADVVLMTDEPSKLADAVMIARRTKRIVWQNIIFAFVVKAIVLTLGAGGLATMWEAVFADVGVALLAVANAMRALNVKCK